MAVGHSWEEPSVPPAIFVFTPDYFHFFFFFFLLHVLKAGIESSYRNVALSSGGTKGPGNMGHFPFATLGGSVPTSPLKPSEKKK